jgi:hypothetical protein
LVEFFLLHFSGLMGNKMNWNYLGMHWGSQTTVFNLWCLKTILNLQHTWAVKSVTKGNIMLIKWHFCVLFGLLIYRNAEICMNPFWVSNNHKFYCIHLYFPLMRGHLSSMDTFWLSFHHGWLLCMLRYLKILWQFKIWVDWIHWG